MGSLFVKVFLLSWWKLRKPLYGYFLLESYGILSLFHWCRYINLLTLHSINLRRSSIKYKFTHYIFTKRHEILFFHAYRQSVCQSFTHSSKSVYYLVSYKRKCIIFDHPLLFYPSPPPPQFTLYPIFILFIAGCWKAVGFLIPNSSKLD